MDGQKAIQINSWRRFSNNRLWKLMIEEIKKEIENNNIIINTVGADCEQKYTMRDLSILKNDAFYKLIKIPEEKINELSGSIEVPTEDMDPYANRDENDDEDVDD